MATDIIARALAANGGGGGEPVDAYTKAETNDLLANKADKNTSYTKTEVNNLLAEKEDNILSFDTWAEYNAVKDSIPADTYFVVKEDEQENPIPSHNSLMNRDANECHPINAITGLQAELDKKTDATDTDVLKARMDQLVGTVPPGSADEIADARVMVDGKTSQNLGDAIRTQVTSLKETINTIENDYKNISLDTVFGSDLKTYDVTIEVEGNKLTAVKPAGKWHGFVYTKKNKIVLDAPFNDNKASIVIATDNKSYIMYFPHNGDLLKRGQTTAQYAVRPSLDLSTITRIVIDKDIDGHTIKFYRDEVIVRTAQFNADNFGTDSTWYADNMTIGMAIYPWIATDIQTQTFVVGNLNTLDYADADYVNKQVAKLSEVVDKNAEKALSDTENLAKKNNPHFFSMSGMKYRNARGSFDEDGMFVVDRENDTDYHAFAYTDDKDVVTLRIADNEERALVIAYEQVEGASSYLFFHTKSKKVFMRGQVSKDFPDAVYSGKSPTDVYYIQLVKNAESMDIKYLDQNFAYLGKCVISELEGYTDWFIDNMCIGQAVYPWGINTHRFVKMDICEFNPVTNTKTRTGYATIYTDQEQNLYDKIKNDIDENTVVFTFITDTHYSDGEWYNSLSIPKITNKISENIGVDFIAHGGDMIYEGTETEVSIERIDAYMRETNKGNLPFLYALAHHEMYPYNWDTFEFALSHKKVNALCGRSNKYVNVVRDSNNFANYYTDFDYQNVRVIVTDSTYHAYGWNAETLTWLENTALNTDKKVIMISHTCPNHMANANTSFLNGDSSQTEEGVKPMEEILKDFCSRGGTVLAYVHGHTHWDNIYKQNDVPFPYISCLATAPLSAPIPEVVGGNPTSPQRTVRTYSQYSFDVFCVHADTDTIKMFRFGAGSDRTYTR